MNIFEEALKTEQPKTTGKTKVKMVVPVDADGVIAKLNSVREKMSALKASEASLVADLKPLAEEQFLKMYKERQARPDSFILQDKDGERILLIVQDKYGKLEPGIEQVIKEQWKKNVDELIEATTVFTFNPEMLQKHGQKISDAINGLDIPPADKKKLVKPDTTKVIKKGTIERLLNYKEWKTLFQIIKPTIQFKNQAAEEKE